MPRPSESDLDVVTLVRNVKELFEVDNKELIVQTTTEPIFIKADKDQIIRVFNNLIKNAIQAIPDGRQGRIEISLKVEAGKVLISIKDNGVGIESSKLGKIFVPYFTTKSTGTGLGLAMVKQIVENHRGSIDFETETGTGTTFFIELPVVTPENN
jgi:signal transduction histidine kinase